MPRKSVPITFVDVNLEENNFFLTEQYRKFYLELVKEYLENSESSEEEKLKGIHFILEELKIRQKNKDI